MRLISRHILRALAGPFVWGVLALTGLLLLNQLAVLIDRFGGKGLGFDVMLEAVILALPALFTLTIPMSVLVATLYAYTTLASDLEMVAMYANGISVWRMVRPALMLAIVAVVVDFVIFDQVVPLSNSRYKTLQLAVYNATPTLSLRPQELNELGQAGYVLRAHDIERESGRLREVSIYDLYRNDGRRSIHADSGLMVRSPSGSDLLLTLYDGEVLDYPRAKPTEVVRTRFAVDVVKLADVEREFKRSLDQAQRGDRERSGCQLLDGIDASDWQYQRATRDRERLTDRDLRSLAGLPPLPPPAVRSTPDFPTHCTGLWGKFQDLLERTLLPRRLEAQQPVHQDTVKHKQAQDTTKAARQDTIAKRADSTPAATSLRLPEELRRKRELRPLKDSLDRLEVTPASQDSALVPIGIRGGGDSANRAGFNGFLIPPRDGQVAVPDPDRIVTSMAAVRSARFGARENLRSVRQFNVEYHKKFAIPLASICFVLIGVALALKVPNGGIGLVIGGSLIIFLIFYVLLIGGENLADEGIVSGKLAMYGPVVVLTIVGVLAVAAADREMGSVRNSNLFGWLATLLPGRRRGGPTA